MRLRVTRTGNTWRVHRGTHQLACYGNRLDALNYAYRVATITSRRRGLQALADAAQALKRMENNR